MIRLLGCLERGLRLGFFRFGLIVGRHPIPFLLIPILISAASIGGFFNYRKDQRAVWYMFSPIDAPSHREHAVMNQFFASKGRDEMAQTEPTNSTTSTNVDNDEGTGENFRLAFGIWAKDGGSLLRPEYLRQLPIILHHIMHNISVSHYGYDGRRRSYTFADLCGSHCEDNEIVSVFSRAYHNPAFRNSPNFQMGWPMMKIMQEHYYVSRTFGGVRLDKVTKTIESVRITLLRFFANKSNRHIAKVLKKWEYAVMAYAVSLKDGAGGGNQQQLVTASAIGDEIISYEVKRNGDYCRPYIGLTLILIFGFVLISSIRPRDPVRSKPWEALGGVLTPVASLLTTFGFMSAVGTEYIALNVVVPFLILAIGVDDAFIMLHAWHKSAADTTLDNKDTVPHRLATAMSHAGPSITMTSLTNMLSFMIGAFSRTPGIQIFCLYTAVGITFAYFYQITLFTAVVALGGRRELRGDNAYFICCSRRSSSSAKGGQLDTNKVNIIRDKIKRPVQEEIRDNSSTNLPLPSHSAVQSSTDKRTTIPIPPSEPNSVFRAYAAMICSKRVKAILGIGLIVYWSVAAYGFSTMKTLMSAQKTLLADSPLHDFMEIVDSEMSKAGGEIYFFVNQPPTFTKPSEVRNFMNFVNEAERTGHSMGSNSTALWLRSYLRFLALEPTGIGSGQQQQKSTTKTTKDSIGRHPFYQNLEIWLKEHRQWSHYVKLTNKTSPFVVDNEHNNATTIQSFFFTTGIQGTSDWDEKALALQTWRGIAAKYTEYQITVAQYGSFYIDQHMSIKSVTVKTVSIALFVMFLTCLAFIPNLTSVLCATGALLSINLGIFGLLNLWHVDLDPISMVTILMSIGFSVDFTCHISYHYYKSEIREPQERLSDALLSIGRPMIQAGLSTLLGISVLIFPRSYMTMVFVKTCFLVVFLGLVHGLLVLPVVLTSIPRKENDDSLEHEDNKSVRPPPKSTVDFGNEKFCGGITRRFLRIVVNFFSTAAVFPQRHPPKTVEMPIDMKSPGANTKMKSSSSSSTDGCTGDETSSTDSGVSSSIEAEQQQQQHQQQKMTPFSPSSPPAEWSLTSAKNEVGGKSSSSSSEDSSKSGSSAPAAFIKSDSDEHGAAESFLSIHNPTVSCPQTINNSLTDNSGTATSTGIGNAVGKYSPDTSMDLSSPPAEYIPLDSIDSDNVPTNSAED